MLSDPAAGQVCEQWAQPLGNRIVAAVELLDDGSTLLATETSHLGPNGTDVTLQRIAPSGALMWERILDNPGHTHDHFGALVVANGRYYLCGTYVDFQAIEARAFLAAIDADGTLAFESSIVGFSASVSGPRPARLRLAVDAAGAATVVGGRSGPCMSSPTCENALIARFAADGTLSWTDQLHLGIASHATRATDVALGPNGMVYVCGDFHPGPSQLNFFLAAYDANGVVQWVVTEAGSIGSVFPGAMAAADTSGNAFLIGETESACGLFEHRVVKVTPTGTPLWNQLLPTPCGGSNQLMDVCVAPGGDILVAGSGSGTSTTAQFDFVTSRFRGADGSIAWSNTHAGASGSADLLTDLAVDAAGRTYVTGHSNFTLPTRRWTTIGYDTDGSQLWLLDRPETMTNARLGVGPGGVVMLAVGALPAGLLLRYQAAQAGSLSTFGSGCPGSNGVPSHVDSGSPTLGSTITHALANGPAGAAAFLALGLSNASWLGTPLPIDFSALGAPGCSVYCSHDDVIGPISLSPAGTASHNSPIPTACNLVGLIVYSQYLLLDPPANALGLTGSNAAELRIGS